MHTGEVGTEIAPAVAADPAQAQRVDELLRQVCDLARAITGAEQAALGLRTGDDASQTRKYFSLGPGYAAWRDYRVDPRGLGLHGLQLEPGTFLRLTQDQVERHPAWRAFGEEAASHPPMVGWLAVAVCGQERRYGLLQLSDPSRGEFTDEDGERLVELAALAGGVLDALRAA